MLFDGGTKFLLKVIAVMHGEGVFPAISAYIAHVGNEGEEIHLAEDGTSLVGHMLIVRVINVNPNGNIARPDTEKEALSKPLNLAPESSPEILSALATDMFDSELNAIIDKMASLVARRYDFEINYE